MAEEKKTGKKFCTKCGKPLKEGEVCDCQKEKKTTIYKSSMNL